MAPSKRCDPTSLDLTGVDLAALVQSTIASTGTIAAKATDLAKDATYVTVGLGVLGFQRAQVKRREIERALRR